MDRTAFESGLHAQDYRDVVDREMAADTVNPEHAHDFDARLLMLDGEMTLVRNGAAETYRKGDTFEVTAGTRHEERAGPQGARYLAGRRHRQAAAG